MSFLSRRSFSAVLVLACTLLVATVSTVAQTTNATKPVSSPADDSVVQQRANALLKQMTSDEKIGQLSVLFAFGPGKQLQDQVRDGSVGSLLFITDPAVINSMQKVAVDSSRLHIPLLFGLDVIHGFRTMFPVPIGMAASWDPAMVERAQSVAAKEARAAGVDWTYAPMVDIARDPRWGRMVEGAGEDPYLGSAMAAAQVRGFQGQYLGAPDHVVACVKHFAGYGAAVGGRDYEDANISDEQLWNVYLPPFRSAIDQGVGTLMSAYMDLNGVPATGNKWLLQSVLRDKWHFKGFVVSDADAVKNLKTHGFAADSADAALRAINAGVNMEMSIGSTAYDKYLPEAFKQGQITDRLLDDAVRPILETKIRLGLFEHPYVDETLAKQLLGTVENKAAARAAAERTAVLLRNEGHLLPLKPENYKSIAVIGPVADTKGDIAGSWTFANNLNENVTVVEALRQQAGAGTRIDYAQGVQIARKYLSPFGGLSKEKKQPAWTEDESNTEFKKAIQLAQQSDLTICVLGEKQDMTGELASSSSLELPGKQEQLLEAVVATGKPVVLVLLNGRPLDISWASEHVPAILEAWYPGTEGGTAIVNLLYGKAVPGGKLPFTWPRNVGQVPIYYSHNLTHAPAGQNRRYWNEESTPLFPFGFGLSYTTFNFLNLQVSQRQVNRGEAVHVNVEVENAGDISADEVVQLYIHQQYGSASRPVRELKGFQRLPLKAHEKKSIEFTLTQDDLSYWSDQTKSWTQDAAPFDVWVGGDSTAPLHASFVVTP